MRNTSLKIANYRCFWGEPEGFDRIMPINLIIGRNNSGKSALLDVVEHACRPEREATKEAPATKLFMSRVASKEGVDNIFPATRAGALIAGRNDQETARQYLVGKRITVELQKSRLLHVDSAPMNDTNSGDGLQQIARCIHNPFPQYHLHRLAPDRDILPESDVHPSDMNQHGQNATRIIVAFQTLAALPDDLLETRLLQALNEIFTGDAHFLEIRAQLLDGGNWEVFLKEEHKGRIALSSSGSGLKTVVLILIMTILVPRLRNDSNPHMFCLEELENNLHPALQRRLFSYLRRVALERNWIFFVTTHSTVAIDIFSRDENAQVLHVTHDGKSASVGTVATHQHGRAVLADLDVRASDLLQANCVIWLEGPSDRIYFNRWMELWTNGTLREGLHYQCVFYGGRLLAHLGIGDLSEQELRDVVDVLRINRNGVVLLDSDRDNPDDALNTTKLRILSEAAAEGMYCWTTAGREIENYLPGSALTSLYPGKTLCLQQYSRLETYLSHSLGKSAAASYLRSKSAFALRIAPHMTCAAIRTVLDLGTRLDDVVARIKRWNGLA